MGCYFFSEVFGSVFVRDVWGEGLFGSATVFPVGC